jgi:hypothetical protein
MTNNNESITETLRDPKHPFRAVADRPKKAQKHRYERRKIRGILKITDWSDDAVAA